MRRTPWALGAIAAAAVIVGGERASESAAAQAGQTPAAFDTMKAKRASCNFGRGDTIDKTVGPSVPCGDSIPIKNVIVLMMENRSFDHYYSGLGGGKNPYNTEQFSEADNTSVDVWPNKTHTGFSYDRSNRKVWQYKEKHYCVQNTAHTWEEVHHQWNNGAMDRFAAESDPGGGRAMGYYNESDLPFYYWIAKNYAISDRYFSTHLGSTWPNRWFFYGATSWGRINTPDVPVTSVELARQPDIVLAMQMKGHSVKFYRGGAIQWASAGFGDPSRLGHDLEDFEEDVTKNRLADLTILDPNFALTFKKAGKQTDDEHPPGNIQKGQRLAARVIKAITSNPAVWNKSALFIMYDEHGGLYDHVPPPAACDPGDGASRGKVDHDGKAVRFDRYGARVPLLVVSPYAKRHYVSHMTADHTSVTRFIEAKFDLGALTKRDANAWPLFDMFDFSKAPQEDPQLKALASTVAAPTATGVWFSAAEDAWCSTHEPATGFPEGGPGACSVGAREAEGNAPNGSAALAQEMKDPGCRGSKGEQAGTLNGGGDVDYFFHNSVDGYTCGVEPQAEFTGPGVEVCVFPVCGNGASVKIKCGDGAALEELGIVEQGCCKTGKTDKSGKAVSTKIEMDYDCIGTTDESGRIYYRVSQKANTCTNYRFKYSY